MSYTSKYTGQEIDNKLDNINKIATTEEVGGIIVGEGLEITEDGILSTLASRGETTTLYSGTANTQGTLYSLSDSVKNYDLILVMGGATDGTVATTTTMINPEDINVNHQFMISNFSSTQYFFKIMFIFPDDISFQPTLSNTTGWGTPAITKVYGIKLGAGGGININENSPIGTIIPYMGTTAPEGYLACDGTTLNIADYTKLAEHFEKQFGSKNHFGGDGTATFAIPDLRNEFLRGYGDKSNEVGIHQDATSFLNIRTWNGGLYADYENNTTICPENMDTTFFSTGKKQCGVNKADMITNTNGQEHAKFTSRPTNVAVLFCIKYTESAVAGNGGSEYSETVIWEGRTVHSNYSDYTVDLSQPVTDFDEIALYATVTMPDGRLRYIYHKISAQFIAQFIADYSNNAHWSDKDTIPFCWGYEGSSDFLDIRSYSTVNSLVVSAHITSLTKVVGIKY